MAIAVVCKETHAPITRHTSDAHDTNGYLKLDPRSTERDTVGFETTCSRIAWVARKEGG